MLVRFPRGSVVFSYVQFLRAEGVPQWKRRITVRELLQESPIDRWQHSLTKARAAYKRGVIRSAHKKGLI